MDYEQILQSAKQGEAVKPEILDSIRDQLESGRYKADPYTLVYILGVAEDKSSHKILWRLVRTNSDEMIRRIAIETLTSRWGLHEYFPIAIACIKEDSAPEVRDAAAIGIGFLGSRHADLRQRAASVLLSGFESSCPHDIVSAESYYCGILELLDIPLDERPSPFKDFTVDEIRWEFVDQARMLSDG